MKQPDAFEEMVERQVRRDVRIHSIDDTSAIMLLRAYHRRVVQVVKSTEMDCHKVLRIVGKNDAHARGMLDGVQVILSALARLKARRR